MQRQASLLHETKLKNISLIKSLLNNLKTCQSLTETRIQKGYDFVSDDHGFHLTDYQKDRIFGFLKKKIKTITRVIDTNDNEDGPEFIAVDFDGEECVVKFEVGEVNHKQSLQAVEDLVTLHDATMFYVVLIEADSMIEFKAPKVNKNMPTTSSGTGSTRNSCTGSTSSCSNSPTNEFKHKDKEQAYERVLRALKNQELHSTKLLESYGKIKYTELFKRLTQDKPTEMDKKWIKYFSESGANGVTHPCLVAIRDYMKTWY